MSPESGVASKIATLLTLDAGNTSVKGVLWRGDEPRLSFRVWASGSGARDPLAGIVGMLGRVDAVVGVAARGREFELGPDMPSCSWIGRELTAPGRVAYDDPDELGPDRRAVAWGALRRRGPALVLDAGTCITLTHVDGEGQMRGLAIAPGFGLLRKALAEGAPALAGSLGGAVPAALPRSTRDNLALGLECGFSGLVLELVADAERRLADASIERGALLVTGSDAMRVAEACPAEIEAGLVHEGLWSLWTKR